MKGRVHTVIATAVVVGAGTFGSTAFADAGGVPNCNAGFGQATSAAASNENNPNDRANRFNTSVQDIQQGTKAQFDATNATHCP